MLKVAISFVCLLFTLISSLSSTNVTCDYKTSTFWAATSMYNCYVTYSIDIEKPENAEIASVTGRHSYGKSSDSEIVFYSYKKNIHYFPRGLEKIYKNLNGIILYKEPINFIQQSDLKPYTKLIFLQVAETKIEVIEDGLFDFNPQLKYLALNENKIFHIGLKVFDNLNNLQSLYLGKNICIDDKVEDNRSNVPKLIAIVKGLCMSTEFFAIDERFLKLEDEMNNLNRRNFRAFEKNVQKLEKLLVKSKFANFTMLQDKLEKLKDVNAEELKSSGCGAVVSKFSLVLMVLCFLVKIL